MHACTYVVHAHMHTHLNDNGCIHINACLRVPFQMSVHISLNRDHQLGLNMVNMVTFP